MNLCSPSESAGVVSGDVQAANPPPSSLQRKLAPESAEEKAKRGVESLVRSPLSGPAVMERSAGLSTFQVREVIGPSFPARSAALTWKVCDDSARSETVEGELQSSKPPPSSRQLKLAPDSFEAKPNDALRSGEVEPLART